MILKKEGGSSNAGSLISVHEGVVSDDAVHEHRRFHHEVRVELCGSKSRSWTTERRLQEGQITDSVLTAGFFDDTIMDEEDLLGREIDHCLARASRAGRYRSMNSVIWSANALVTRPFPVTLRAMAGRRFAALVFAFLTVRVAMIEVMILEIDAHDNPSTLVDRLELEMGS